jgi:branched-chain amino acid transport system substrate-binding protein
MPRRVLARSRALSVCLFAALAAGLGGCTAANTAVTATGSTLRIYANVPGQATDAQAADVLDAERLALAQLGGQVGTFKVVLVPAMNGNTDAQITANARQAIKDAASIAYIGELVPHTSSASAGITNAQDLLQVSPTDTALELTQKTPAVPSAPNKYYESLGTYGHTFARVVPTTALEAKAQVQEMQALHVSKLYVASDGTPYGAAIAYAVRQDAAPAISVVSDISSADGFFYGASSASAPAAAQRFDSVAATAGSRLKLFAPDAINDPTFSAALTSPVAQRNVYLSSPGFLAANLTTAGTTFVHDFRAAYGHAPSREAIFGYEAMSAVLAVLKEAGSSANNRSVVVRDFLAIRNRPSVLGTYSINGTGDTNLGPFVFSHFAGGALVPFKFVPVQG